jgi:hypothetical protein
LLHPLIEVKLLPTTRIGNNDHKFTDGKIKAHTDNDIRGKSILFPYLKMDIAAGKDKEPAKIKIIKKKKAKYPPSQPAPQKLLADNDGAKA